MKQAVLCRLSIGLLCVSALMTPGPQAATITVTNAHDNGPGSLRDAISASHPGDEIVFDPSMLDQTVVLTTGELLIDHDLSISGLGQQQTILDGNRASRIFRITEEAEVTISNLMVRNGLPKECLEDGRTRSEGGGIYNAGHLELEKISIIDNLTDYRNSQCDEYDYDRPESIRGGGIYNAGTLVLDRSEIDANSAFGQSFSYGGGLYNSGDAMLTDSIVSGNTGSQDRFSGLRGSGIYNESSGTVQLFRCAMSHNILAKAIDNSGNLTMVASTIAGSGDWRGGGFLNRGVATITETVITHNWSGVGSDAGGIINMGTMTVERSTIDGNSGNFAGAIANSGVMRVTNSTISSNDGFQRAGGIEGGTATLIGTTITGNQANFSFAGFASEGTIKSTIIAGNYNPNYPEDSDCGGEAVSLGHNLIGVAHGCDGIVDGVNGDAKGVDWSLVMENRGSFQGYPQIELADTGGPTQTVALLPDSPAIDAVPVSSCTDFDGNPLLTDQRLVLRPQGPACDVGAFEAAPPRGTGFWEHQCSGLGYTQLSPAEMQALFDRVAAAAPAFPECAPVGCGTLDPPSPRTDMRLKAQRGLLGLWLNLITGRLTRGRPIDLPALTKAASAGAALAEIEATVCDPDAARSDLATAKEIADAINAPAGDMELVSAEPSATVQPDALRFFTLAIANMSEDVRNYDVTSAGTWPVSLSATRINGLGPGQVGTVTATLFVPGGTANQFGQIQVTATDSSSDVSLVRTATIRILVNGAVNSGGGGSPRRRLQQ